MTVLPVAEWAPDMPDLSEATNIALNVMALTPESYGPLRNLLPYTTNTLNAPCLGMGAGEDTNLNHHVFAGTINKLWRVNTGQLAWSDRSGAAYATATNESWRFAQYKNLMLATNFSNPIQSYDMVAGGNFADLSGAAPRARFLVVAKGFAITANTFDASDGLNTARLWWSAVNNPASWPTPGTAGAQQVMSDFNDLLGPQGEITGLVPNLAGCDCAVFFERGVFRMIFAGPPAVFDFYPAATVKGCPAPNSLVPFGAYVFFLGEDGYYMFDGNVAVPIGANKIDRWFFSNLDPSAFNLIIGAADIANKAICWIFRSIYAPSHLPDMMVVYRWDIERWSNASITMQWISRVPVVTTTGASPPSDLGLTAGQLQLAAVDQNRYLAFFSGSNLPAQIGTKVVQLTPYGRTFVNITWPLIDSAPPQGELLTESGIIITTESGIALLTEADSAAITVALSARDNYQQPEVFGTDQPLNVIGQAPQRSDGRFHRGRISIASGIWTTCAGLDVTGLPAGYR